MAIVDDEDEFTARLRMLPEHIENEWPETTRLDLAAGRAVRVEPPLSTQTTKRSRDAVSRLIQEPSFHAEMRRIFGIAGDYQPFPSGGRRNEIREWDEDHQRRYAIIRREAVGFAAARRFPYISPPGVVAIFIRLLGTLRRDVDGRPPRMARRIRHLHDAPVFYVNPLAERELSAPVGPGHIVVDLTHASTADLLALVKPLGELQQRLGFGKRGGGPRPEDRKKRCRAFQAELPIAIYRARDARAENGNPRHGDLSQHELAAAFGWHEDTLRARLAACGIDWVKTRRRVGSRVVAADSA